LATNSPQLGVGAARPPFALYLGPVALLTLVAAFLLRDHLLGDATFLGNPDRLNHNLKVLRFYVDGLQGTGLQAWNEVEMLGYDALALPYTYPNPLTLLAALTGAEDLILTAGWISFALISAAGWSSDLFCRQLVSTGPALVAALLYQCSALAILKASQNDMSFAVLVLLPLLALMLRKAHARPTVETCLGSFVIFFLLLQFCFLQKAAYAVLFAGAYGGFLLSQRFQPRVAVALLGGFAAAVIAAGPRLLGLAATVSEYVRIQPGEKLDTFSDLFRYHGIRAVQALRWFEDGILGKYFSDATALANGINLSEGFLLYTSAFAPALIIAAMLSRRPGWNGSVWGRPNEARFFLWLVLAASAAALLRPANYVLYLLFAKVDFMHARVIVIALLPLVAYAALRLEALGRSVVPGQGQLRYASAGGALGLALVGVIEWCAWSLDGYLTLAGRAIDLSAAARAAASGLACFGLLHALRSSARLPVRRIAFPALCTALAVQAIVGADFRLNGKHTRTESVAFRNGDIFFAPRTDFRAPSRSQKALMHETVERDQYRSVIVCDRESAGGFCAAHVGQFWGLRLADGYYGTGVPARLAVLPWESAVGLRHIVFTSGATLPWPLLGLLNVKYAIINDADLYRNANSLPPGSAWPRRIVNPGPVTPRAFFAAQISPVRSPAEARERLFTNGVVDPRASSFVEELPRGTRLSTEGTIRISANASRVDVTVSASRDERFLVINELVTPRWSATVDGAPAKVYATNVFMRGVLIPPGATSVNLAYRPTAGAATSFGALAGALVMLLVLGYGLRATERRAGA
jgi:hypothetical protein